MTRRRRIKIASHIRKWNSWLRILAAVSRRAELELTAHYVISFRLPQTNKPMISKCIVLFFGAAVLAGCCVSGNGCYAPVSGTPMAWDGLGTAPTEKRQRRAKAGTKIATHSRNHRWTAKRLGRIRRLSLNSKIDGPWSRRETGKPTRN